MWNKLSHSQFSVRNRETFRGSIFIHPQYISSHSNMSFNFYFFSSLWFYIIKFNVQTTDALLSCTLQSFCLFVDPAGRLQGSAALYQHAFFHCSMHPWCNVSVLHQPWGQEWNFCSWWNWFAISGFCLFYFTSDGIPLLSKSNNYFNLDVKTVFHYHQSKPFPLCLWCQLLLCRKAILETLKKFFF